MGSIRFGSKKQLATIVCVTDQFNCERLIRAGKEIADLTMTSLYVINVTVADSMNINADALEYLYKISKENNADMTVYYDNDIMKIFHSVVKKCRGAHIVTGLPFGEDSIVKKMWKKFPYLNFHTVSHSGEIESISKGCVTVLPNQMKGETACQ